MEDIRHYRKFLAIAHGLARLLDTQFSIGRFRFGVDPIISLVPGIGSGISTILSLYILWIALIIGTPPRIYLRMVWYIWWDFVLGEIPVVGNIADFFYKANIKNVALLEQYLDEKEGIIDGEVVDSV